MQSYSMPIVKPQLHIHDFGHSRAKIHPDFQIVMHRHDS